MTGERVAWFSFETDSADQTANHAEPVFSGTPTLENGALRFRALSDVATLQIASDLLFSDCYSGIAVDFRLRVQDWLAYGVASAPILLLYANWDTQLAFIQDKWADAPHLVVGANQHIASAESIRAAMPLDQWHRVRILHTAATYELWINGQLLSSATSTADELERWHRSELIDLEFGGFNGWMDDVRITRLEPPKAASPAAGLFALEQIDGDSITLSHTDAIAGSYRVLESADLNVWMPARFHLSATPSSRNSGATTSQSPARSSTLKCTPISSAIGNGTSKSSQNKSSSTSVDRSSKRFCRNGADSG